MSALKELPEVVGNYKVLEHDMPAFGIKKGQYAIIQARSAAGLKIYGRDDRTVLAIYNTKRMVDNLKVRVASTKSR